MFSPCSQGVSSTKNPNRKNMQKQNILLSVRDRDGQFTWSPGAEKLPTAPGGSWRKYGPGWVKCRAYISQRPQACVCLGVCVLCRLHKIHVCVAVCISVYVCVCTHSERRVLKVCVCTHSERRVLEV